MNTFVLELLVLVVFKAIEGAGEGANVADCILCPRESAG